MVNGKLCSRVHLGFNLKGVNKNNMPRKIQHFKYNIELLKFG